MRIERDIFEDVKEQIGCEYISDLPMEERRVTEAMKKIDISKYRKENVTAFFKYVSSEGMSFGK